MDETIEKVQALLKKKLKVDSIDSNKELRELGLDSLDVVELICAMEDEFGVSFTTEELKSLKKVSDLYTSIKDKLKK